MNTRCGWTHDNCKELCVCRARPTRRAALQVEPWHAGLLELQIVVTALSHLLELMVPEISLHDFCIVIQESLVQG